MLSANSFYNYFNDSFSGRDQAISNLRQVITLDASGVPIPFQTQFPFGHPSYSAGGLELAAPTASRRNPEYWVEDIAFALSERNLGGKEVTEKVPAAYLIELNYQQQYTFLPGWLGGFGSYMNFTWLETYGNYGSGLPRSELANFRSRIFNAGLSYVKYGFSGRIHLNYLGRYLTTFNANQPNRVYVEPQTLNRNLRVFWDTINMFDAPIRRSQGYAHRINHYQNVGPRISVGVSGRY